MGDLRPRLIRFFWPDGCVVRRVRSPSAGNGSRGNAVGEAPRSSERACSHSDFRALQCPLIKRGHDDVLATVAKYKGHPFLNVAGYVVPGCYGAIAVPGRLLCDRQTLFVLDDKPASVVRCVLRNDWKAIGATL